MDSIRKKEDALYRKSPKRYHNNPKTAAGLQPRANDQPNLATVRDPTTNLITCHPQTIRNTIQTHYTQENSRTTLKLFLTILGKTPPTQTRTTPNARTPSQPNTHWTTSLHVATTQVLAKGHSRVRPMAPMPCLTK